MKILVLGVTGMLGNAVFRYLTNSPALEVWGTARNDEKILDIFGEAKTRIIKNLDVEHTDLLIHVIERIQPDIVINCIGLIKQRAEAEDPLLALPINSLLPHRLARLCSIAGARLIHISTDCVFSGKRGQYTEEDYADAEDLYGRSKYLGEVASYPNAITLRTSMIGHELNSHRSLIGWFLAQQERIQGYTKAIFTGIPTVELARIIRDYILPKPDLHGLYQVAAAPITKYDLLKLVATTYGKQIDIIPNETIGIDRSLIGKRFEQATGYIAPDWPALITDMHQFH